MQGNMVDWSCVKMKRKIFIAFVILGMAILLFGELRTFEGLDLSEEQIAEVYIEVIAEDEKSVEKLYIEDEDATVIKKILLKEESYSDNGFVFAEGGYRIVMDTEKEFVNFYPYCGNTSTIRVGDEGYEFVWLDGENAENLQIILDKYNCGREGIWDWSNVK